MGLGKCISGFKHGVIFLLYLLLDFRAVHVFFVKCGWVDVRENKTTKQKIKLKNLYWGEFLLMDLLGQWLTFKLLGIPYLVIVGKIEFKLLFQGPGRLSEWKKSCTTWAF